MNAAPRALSSSRLAKDTLRRKLHVRHIVFVFVVVLIGCRSYEAAPGRVGSRPAGPAPAARLVHLGAGKLHACAVEHDGRVVCWGDNRQGQVGDGTYVSRAKPTPVRGMPRAAEVALGDAFSCGRRGGEVMCWGANTFGQLGVGGRGERTGAVPVHGLGDAVEIAAGAEHACARRANGTVACWGRNHRGQLGDGTLVDRMRPVDVVGLHDVAQLAAGDHYTCARQRSGAVLCWGENTDEQLGAPRSPALAGMKPIQVPTGWSHGPQTEEAWVATVPVANLVVRDARTIAIGDRVGCAIRTSGALVCWGHNIFGQLATPDDTVTQRELTAVAGAVEVAVGGTEACARFADGSVQCWGMVVAREPHQTSSRRRGPEPIALPAPAVALAMGDQFACASLATGGAACWGDNALDQLGTGRFVNEELGTIKGVEGATAVSASFVHACALRAGRVLCWEPQDPVGHADPPYAVAGITDAVQLSSGVRHDCAVLASRQVVCWGDPFVGALGDGSKSPSQKPVRAVGVTDAVQVAAGGAHTCARLSTGKVMCWGENDHDLLGIGRRDSMQLVPAEVQGLRDAVELAVGMSSTCARRATGAVACWGSNDSGVLGDGTKTDRGTPKDVPGLTRIEEITLGSRHACARTRGRVLCWGANEEGQLGDGTTIERRRPVAVVGIDDAIAISADGEEHTCALRASGQVLCWGANNVFQLGMGSGPSRSTPQDIAGLADATAISAGGDESCAIRKDRSVVCWSRRVPQDQRGFEYSAVPLRVAFER